MAAGNENETEQQRALDPNERPRKATEAGIVVVVVDGQPHYEAFAVPKNRALTIGRSSTADIIVEDAGVSRHHLRILFDGTTWSFSDLGTDNGSFVDGVRIAREPAVTKSAAPRVIRLGKKALLTPVDDVKPYLARELRVVSGQVVGPLLGAVYAQIDMWGASGQNILVRGESGTGKADAAARYARACRRPLNVINVSTATGSLAPSTLFGAKKGAYSGADTDREGWFGAAHGKALFLDEMGELPLDVQPMLLHVVETGDIVPVGASTPRKVDVRLVAATHVDLEAAVAAGKFRHDLFARLGLRSVTIPPLRDRRSDIPAMIRAMIARIAEATGLPELPVEVPFIEACLLQDWPTNVRGLERVLITAFESAHREQAPLITLDDAPEIDHRATADADGAKLAALKAAYARLKSVRAAAEEVGLPKSTAHEWLKKAGLL